MDFTVNYLGMKLPHPFMPGASPMAQDLDTVDQLVEAGAAMITMHSLFEERVVTEAMDYSHAAEFIEGANHEATSYLPEVHDFLVGPDAYLDLLRTLKKRVDVPVVASLNGVSTGGWLRYAKMIEEAGADALEINPYEIVCGVYATAGEIESRMIGLVGEVRKKIDIPITVKLLPTVMGLPSLVERLREAGADGVVMFNRIYDPVIDIEELEISSRYPITKSDEISSRLRALGVASSVPGLTLTCSGGVHTMDDAVRALLCGAHGVQMVSSLLNNGPSHLKMVISQVKRWFEEHEYTDMNQARGSMSMNRCGNPTAYTRLGYMKSLSSFSTT